MRISPISYNIKKTNTLNFASNMRKTFIYDGETHRDAYSTSPFVFLPSFGEVKLVNANTTRFLRDDLPWECLRKILDEQFPQDEKINVYNFACSDGSEPYSLALTLIEQYGEEGAKRFFPIYASDIDEAMVDIAQNIGILATEDDLERLNEITKDNILKYFIVQENHCANDYTLFPKDIIKDVVEFSVKDIESGIDEIKPSNSLVLCRHCWKYFGADKICSVAQKLNEKLDESSRIFIGDFDKQKRFVPDFFEKFGFVEASDFWREEFILKKAYESLYETCNKNELKTQLEKYCTLIY